MQTAVPALDIRNIHKKFDDLEVLKGISLSANDHDVVSILGSSGSGKSTFLRCINLLETPTSGEVSVYGETIKMKQGKHGPEAADKEQVQRIRSQLAMVFQQFNLWSHMTVLQNVTEAPIARAQAGQESKLLSPRGKILRARRHDRAQGLLIPRSFPVVSSNGWRLPGRWRWNPRHCCLTSPPPRWTRSSLTKY